MLLRTSLAILLFFSISWSDSFQLAPRLPNGLTIEPAGRTSDVGNMPLSALALPDGKLALLLSGFRQQGLQIFDVATGQVLQTVAQPAAFFGLAYSQKNRKLFASGATEDVIYVYDWKDGAAQLSGKIALGPAVEKGKIGVHYPAGIALSNDERFLYVAENLSDMLAVVDLKTATVVDRKPAGHFPYAVVVGSDAAIYVSAWGGSSITRFRHRHSGGALAEPVTLNVLRHPSALLLNSKGSRLFFTSASTDSIGIIDTKKFRMINTLSNSAPGVKEGSTPNALALSSDGMTLFVAEADSNAIAVFGLSKKSSGASKETSKQDRLLGRIPVGWYPTALVALQNQLYVINGKGKGTRANPTATQGYAYVKTPTEYTLGQLNGTVTQLPINFANAQLQAWNKRVAELNAWSTPRKQNKYPPFKHVLYIIKENRTYDQVFGDMSEGDGDSSLIFFPKSASPNHRAIARRFGLFDRFFVNAEVSSQGHPWSTSAYVTDFREKTVHSTYSSRRDEEPASDDASDPAMGYLWDLAMRNKISVRIYGEYAEPAPDKKTYRAVKKSAEVYTSAIYPSYDLHIQDQTRVDAWLTEFNEFVKKNDMPALQIFHLPNDHTAGAAAGMPTPQACFADNDLAVGRLIEALSRSPFWKDTIVFILEDDSQSGPDHVDSHRSVLLAVSAYNRKDVYHRFLNTTDVLQTIEEILGLGSLSQFDHYGRPLYEIFSSQPDLTPYTALIPTQSLTEKNPPGKQANASLQLKLDKPDISDDEVFNRILWAAIKGDTIPFPQEHRVSLLQLQQEK
jgi:DNA-binding beta-propeller fold protein YncE